VPSIKVTGVIIAKDAEGTIGECLHQLAELDEVVVYENGSADRTAEIAGSFANVVVIKGGFIGFGPTKNLAANRASHDWILSVDSDEYVTPELMSSIAAADLSDPNGLFEVHRHNYLMGRRVRHSGWGNDWLPRLYNRRVHGYNEAMVHENVIAAPGARVQRLQGPLLHEAYTDLGQFLVKINRYSELRMTSGVKSRPPLVIFLKSAWAFVRAYFLRLGFLDGWRGLVIAWANASGVFFRLMKCYARDHVDSDQGRLL